MPDFRKVARRKARKYNLNPDVFERQIAAESNFNPDARSQAGAKGIAQIMPGTAKGWGVDPMRPRQALDAAARNMAGYVSRYGSYENALRAYNAGPGAIEKSKGYAETNSYVNRILKGGEPAGGEDGGGFTPARVQTGTRSSFDQDGFEQAQKRAVLGQMIARRRGTDSVLFRTGVLSTQQPDQGDFTTTRQTPKIVGGSSPLGAAASHGAAGTAVQAAQARIGVGEQGSSNRGGRLDKWQAKFGMVGQPWCGIFVGISLKQAGVKVDSSVASVAAIEQNAKAGRGGFRGWGAPTDARPGDALVTRAGGHVGLVERVDRKRGVIYTIEGNTGNGRVERRTHRMDQVHGVARPSYGGGR